MNEHCQHEDGAHAGLAGSALHAALAEADARCAQRHERMTDSRRRVLELLLEADAPLKAYDLIASFGASGKAAKPPTVYRALDFLQRMGLAHRIESLNAYVPCRMDGAGHAAAFLICDCCGGTDEFEPEFGPQLTAAQAAGYRVRSVTLEVRGRCPACAG